ncbi:hypothetical protein C2G38_2219067 [Gigaspora rosea]|uniref:Uncharacterized protein n=1 Tax=Gigaspora rosea TaxID=44941 RepID=A0A397U608_9GLOM|nr:hypothetical protein C2G38_2219067 [Gigaspora rosea]
MSLNVPVKLSLVEVKLPLAMINALLEEAVAKTKSGETLLTLTFTMMILSQTTIKTNEPENMPTSLTGIKFTPNNPYLDTIHENSQAEQTHMAGLEIDDQRILEAAGKVDDQHIATNDNSMWVTGDASKEIDKMETELISTVEEEKGTDPIPTYSAVLKTGDSRKRKPKLQDNT